MFDLSLTHFVNLYMFNALKKYPLMSIFCRLARLTTATGSQVRHWGGGGNYTSPSGMRSAKHSSGVPVKISEKVAWAVRYRAPAPQQVKKWECPFKPGATAAVSVKCPPDTGHVPRPKIRIQDLQDPAIK